ncbi:MAG: hypothetical protein WC455_13605 [Dehalococcoidia bacterium]
MIKKTGGGYKVVSHSGKSLSHVYKRIGEAKKRLAEIEYWKARKGSK